MMFRTQNYYFKETDFESTTSAYTDPWLGGAISSGTAGQTKGNASHPAVQNILSSSSALSGYQYSIASGTTFLLNSDYYSRFVFNPARNGSAAQNSTTLRFGFLDTFTATGTTDGAYINVTFNASANSFNVTGHTVSNSVGSKTTTTYYGMTNGTWYTGEVYVVNTSLVRFAIFSESGTLLWNDTISSSSTIPVTGGREVSNGFLWVLDGAGTGGVFTLGTYDYLNVGVNKSLVR